MNRTQSVAYVVVTPVRDEASNIPHTIASFASQSLLPQRWILVDDGSSDATGRIADEAAAQHPWITVIHRQNRGFRKTGGGVVEAFHSGYERVQGQPWDFLAKMDADLSFEPDYFEKCFAKFAQDPKLGIAGGLVWEHRNGKLVVGSPGDPAFHVRGATKVYRRKCWEQIGGLMESLGWDTVDELKANMLGWRTATFKDLKLIHHKLLGSADGSWKHVINAGRANYVTGYHPLFMILKCLKRYKQKPYLVAAFGLFLGFFSGYVKRVPRVQDESLIRWVRDQQMRRLRLKSSLWS
jgi:poly-beta-1,6-N-acetyl-D-glucosamine synthase